MPRSIVYWPRGRLVAATEEAQQIEEEVDEVEVQTQRAYRGERADELPIADISYYQVWAPRHGFMANLSVLDLMMNTGREGIDTLLRSTSPYA